MESTLLVGDFLLVNKAVYGARVPLAHVRMPAAADPARGEVLVFAPSHDPANVYVKRLIGMPGDTLAMRAKVLYVNGQPQAESYAVAAEPHDVYSSGMFWQCDHAPAGISSAACRPTRDNWGPLVVPTGRYFVMGDNRDDSEDSRYWGFIQRDDIRGRPLFVYYSFDADSRRTAPWLSSIRWGRIGEGVH